MQDRRTTTGDYCALTEDRGIFKCGVVDVAIHVTPLCRQTTRGDLLFIGYIGDREIELVIPGRRRLTAGPLERALQGALRKAGAIARAQKRPLPLPDHVRFPLKVRGTWRVRIVDEGDSDLSRCYQLLAAEWTHRTIEGSEKTFGIVPKS